jgi:ParB-like chromosome segregation protein Spo0J
MPTSTINESLEPLAVPLDQLHEDPGNVRRHSKRNVKAIEDSLRSFGQQKPLVALSDGRVVAGNGTLHAARNLGWTHLAVVRFADEDRARAFAIADNRSAELAEWDLQGLGATLRALAPDADLHALGFDDHELEPLLAAEWKPRAVDPDATHAAAVAPIRLTAEQREVFERTAERVREQAKDDDLSDGRCVELICTAYLAAPQ